MNEADILQHLHTERGQEYREAFALQIPKINTIKSDVAILLAHGFSNMQIAYAIGITTDAVDDHRSFLRKAIGLERDEPLEPALHTVVDRHRKSWQ